MNFKTAFSRRLDELIKYKNITRASFARFINTPTTTVYQWFDGRSTPKLEDVKNIAEYFNVNTEWLIFGNTPIDRKVDMLNPSIRFIPLIHNIKQLDMIDESERIEKFPILDTESNKYIFSALVNSSSSLLPCIRNRDILLLRRPVLKERLGDIVIAKTGDDFLLRRLSSIQPLILTANYPTVESCIKDSSTSIVAFVSLIRYPV